MTTRTLLIPLLLSTILLGGCINFLADRLVAPPNGHDSTHPQTFYKKLAKNQLRVPVGASDHAATLALWILDPKDLKANDPTHGTGPKGTILCLHGFNGNHHNVDHQAKALQKAGYRAIQIDLRGHGLSTGDHISYGIQDAYDLADLTSYLQQHDLCGPTVGVFGISYGAATAILYAAHDPRVTAVVAVAPFATLRQEASYFGRRLVPIPGLFLSDADYNHLLDVMGKNGRFNPDDASPLAAITQTRAHIRLFAGTDDQIVNPDSSRQLAAANPDRTLLTLFPGKGHYDLCLDFAGTLRPPTQAWFDQFLATPPVVNNP
jgi:pimeloyl-ACP methyl ester carboxylesterase